MCVSAETSVAPAAALQTQSGRRAVCDRDGNHTDTAAFECVADVDVSAAWVWVCVCVFSRQARVTRCEQTSSASFISWSSIILSCVTSECWDTLRAVAPPLPLPPPAVKSCRSCCWRFRTSSDTWACEAFFTLEWSFLLLIRFSPSHVTVSKQSIKRLYKNPL